MNHISQINHFSEIIDNAIFCNLYCINKNYLNCRLNDNKEKNNEQKGNKQIKLSGFIGIQYLVNLQKIESYKLNNYQDNYQKPYNLDNLDSNENNNKKNNKSNNEKEYNRKYNGAEEIKEEIKKEFFFLPIEKYKENKILYIESIPVFNSSEIYKTINDFMNNKIELVNLKDFDIIDKRLIPYYINF